MFEDKTLVCKECGKEFVFTAGEQEFYAERGFQNEPQRCKACRDARKNATRGPREYYTATCAACGGEARVPFEPKSDRPVYCSDCFARMQAQGSATYVKQRSAPDRVRIFYALITAIRAFYGRFACRCGRRYDIMHRRATRKGGRLCPPAECGGFSEISDEFATF